MAIQTSAPKTLYEKIWGEHVVHLEKDGTCLLYIDAHFIHEVTSPQGFEGLRIAGRSVRRADLTHGVLDHNVPTGDRSKGRASYASESEDSRLQMDTFEENCQEFGISYFDLFDRRQGIAHLVGPEQGITQPGKTVVCGDSHTSTHGALGALGFGIGSSEVEHVLATQTLIQKPTKTMRISVNGTPAPGTTAKDIILAIIRKIGINGGSGYTIEYAGETIRNLSIEGRMTVCNMSIEAGARAGLIAPDETTFTYLKNRPHAPKGDLWNKALNHWQTLYSDDDAQFDKEVTLSAQDIEPLVTWGTTPEDSIAISDVIPAPEDFPSKEKQNAVRRALQYMDLKSGTSIKGLKIDQVFIGSCTNARIEDLREAADLLKDKKIASHVKASVVPASTIIRQQAIEEGLDKIFTNSGFEFKEAGCSMCLGMNSDIVKPKTRVASTANRNFEGRHGPGGRVHLMSPAMAAIAALTGEISDIRDFI